MNRLPECLIIVDPNKEKNAIREARLLGITTCALIDTDCNPDDVDLPVPGNDDGIRSVELILNHLSEAVIGGAKNVTRKKEGDDSKKQTKEGKKQAVAEKKEAKEGEKETVAEKKRR